MERKYDTTFIIDGDLGQLDREAIIKRFSAALENNNARIERIVRWGMRTLAYEIKKKSRGYYVIFYYYAEPAIIKTVERDLRINENVLRYMTVKFDGEHPSYIADEGSPDLKGQSLPEVVLDENDDETVDGDDMTEDEAMTDDDMIGDDDMADDTGDNEIDDTDVVDEDGDDVGDDSDEKEEN